MSTEDLGGHLHGRWEGHDNRKWKLMNYAYEARIIEAQGPSRLLCQQGHRSYPWSVQVKPLSHITNPKDGFPAFHGRGHVEYGGFRYDRKEM
ncbi:hypothetical protein AnigIFM60653_010842 [Aspergillus niger]|nr:hypothetical protein AnigIFM50267_002938 [Aspergillus niger]GLA00989.1 hypothetical protein AnigIFM60653_010842 [Aspergillus niger]GLA20503.1 hypothetical protein AnigIFM62618_009078 [Aspergillus niger]